MRILFNMLITSVLIALSSVAAAQGKPGDAAAPQNFETYTPRAEAVRISSDEAPVIDGDLSDAAWGKANIISEFYQVTPVEGATPSQPTRAYILYDEKYLYVGVYLYDSNPAGIRRSQLQRDPNMPDEDAIRVIIDSNGTFRDSYFFAMNANGAKLDALSENGNSFLDEWDPIWNGKAKVVDDGWIAEFAIPFQSISFDPSLDEWNLQLIRTVRRNNEDIRWANIDQSRNFIDLTNPGRLTGIQNIDSGIGLEVQAYVTGSASYDWETGQNEYQFDPSGNVFYKITPSLTGSLTFNTDFSDAPLDERQVNTGRFSLFFPETRDFFLQDSALFQFGGIIFEGRKNGLPFFSRNIGIVSGRPVDIIAGAKVSGKAGPANIGAIATRTSAADSIDVDGQFLTSARVSAPILAESQIGLIFTNGNPSGATNNTVAGADFQYKRSNVFGQGTVQADSIYVRSFNDGVEDDMVAMHARYRSPTWNAETRIRHIGENYSPALGFVNRTGIRLYNFQASRDVRPKDSFIRFATAGAWTNIVTDLDDRRLDQSYGFWMNANNVEGDLLGFQFRNEYAEIREPFSIAGQLPVNAGEYRWRQLRYEASSSRSRPVGARVVVEHGGVFDGDFLSVQSTFLTRPSQHFELSVNHNFIEFDLPTGHLGIHIGSLKSTIAFTPDMFINTEVQYDNISEALSYFSRFTWTPLPHQEVFLSLGHTALVDRQDFPRDFRSLGSSVSLRLGHTFRR